MLTDLLQSAVAAYGSIAVFLLMVPEAACIPVPSEAILLFAGIAVHDGRMAFWLAVAAGTAGNVAGSLVAYAAGRAGALRGRHALERCERLLARHGGRAVLLARVLPLARTFISVPAGHARMPLGPFVAYTTLGCALWAAAFVALGALAGEASIGPLGALGAVASVLVLTWLWRTRSQPGLSRRTGRRQEDRTP